MASDRWTPSSGRDRAARRGVATFVLAVLALLVVLAVAAPEQSRRSDDPPVDPQADHQPSR